MIIRKIEYEYFTAESQKINVGELSSPEGVQN